jgi:7-cyano-7-deazaguanine synthase
MVVDGSKEGQADGAPSAVLCSGGLDSAVLVADERTRGEVQPVFVKAGLSWEPRERAVLERLLAAPIFDTGVRPLVTLSCPVTDVYAPAHWALTGHPPSYNTPDRDVYLVGRNVLLLSKVAVFCATKDIGRVVMGPLAGNPFPDATPEFFDLMGRAVSAGLDHRIEIVAPFAELRKEDVIARGSALGVPWELTLSCMSAADGVHCGRCSKCRERLQAFAATGLTDPAAYAYRPADVATGR